MDAHFGLYRTNNFLIPQQKISSRPGKKNKKLCAKIMPSRAPHHLEGVQESGQLVEPLRTIGGHSTFYESIEFVDVGKTQFIKVLLALQTFNWNWWKHRNTLVRSQAMGRKALYYFWNSWRACVCSLYRAKTHWCWREARPSCRGTLPERSAAGGTPGRCVSSVCSARTWWRCASGVCRSRKRWVNAS